MVECQVTYIPNFTTILQYSRNGYFMGLMVSPLPPLEEDFKNITQKISVPNFIIFEQNLDMKKGDEYGRDKWEI